MCTCQRNKIRVQKMREGENNLFLLHISNKVNPPSCHSIEWKDGTNWGNILLGIEIWGWNKEGGLEGELPADERREKLWVCMERWRKKLKRGAEEANFFAQVFYFSRSISSRLVFCSSFLKFWRSPSTSHHSLSTSFHRHQVQIFLVSIHLLASSFLYLSVSSTAAVVQVLQQPLLSIKIHF